MDCDLDPNRYLETRASEVTVAERETHPAFEWFRAAGFGSLVLVGE